MADGQGPDRSGGLDAGEGVRGGRLPDPGEAAVCARCGEPRPAHGGPKHLGACPGEHGVRAPRFQLRDEDKPESWERANPSLGVAVSEQAPTAALADAPRFGPACPRCGSISLLAVPSAIGVGDATYCRTCKLVFQAYKAVRSVVPRS